MAERWWEDKNLWLGVLGFGGLVAGLQLAGYTPVDDLSSAASDAVFAVKDIIGRGQKLGSSSLDSSGTVTEDPESLRQAASVIYGQDIPADVYAAARMVRSEGAKEGELRVHVALNDLASLGWSGLFDLITYSTVASRKGLYGSQTSRRYASSKDPYEADVNTVIAAMNDHAGGIDPAQGATKFVDKSSFGVQAGTGSFDDLVARWGADGLQPFTVPEYGTDLVLFKKG